MIQATKMFLNERNFVKEQTVKTAIVLHHTAGGHRPDSQISYWDSDLLGRVGTHYVIGGISSDGKDKTYDGDIFQAIDDKYYAFHLGIKGNLNRFDKQSIAIELCNYGFLVKSQNGKFYNYVQKEVHPDQVLDLGYRWKGYQYWHKYTDLQIQSLKELLTTLMKVHEIQKTKVDFDFHAELMNLQKINGIFTHVNFRKDKFDNCPQPNLIKMLESL